MFTHLKLATFTWILASLLTLTAAVISVSAFLIEKNIDIINDTWELYQTDQSEKARYEGALRAAIGYNGMIHNFKNYVLRNDVYYKEQVESHLGAAKAVLKQYSALELTAAESVAIQDMLRVFTAYEKAVHQIQTLITQDYSVTDINNAVKIDDEPAIRALKVLRYEIISKQKTRKQLSKSRIVADLHAALGYDGMIHKFKNYILHHTSSHNEQLKDRILIDEINNKIRFAKNSINQYRALSPSEAEKLALNDIESTLKLYSNNFTKVHQLMERHKSVKEVDRAVKVDDTPALRGFHILKQEINRQLTAESANVTKALEEVNQAILLGKWSSIITIIFVMLVAIVLIRFYVIQPVLRLTQHMIRLADNKLDTEISGYQEKNEIGQMARAVMVFKTSMKKQLESGQNLAKTNTELQQQLDENKQLRERAEEQTTKAMLMSEHMAAARNAAEKAMTKAEKGEIFVSSILNAVRDGIITINSKGIIEAFNPGAEDIFGYKTHEMLGKNISMLMPEPIKSAHDDYIKRFLDGKSMRDQTKPLEQNALRKNGETFPAEITLNSINIADEVKVTGVIRDITERKKWEEQIKQLALTDPLTGLANRNQYNQKLKEIAHYSHRYTTKFALLLIDLDKFKLVNDTFGHAAGDVLLQKVAEVLLNSCREVDTVARLGGDEFVIILNDIKEPEDVAILAEKLGKKLSEPLIIENNNIQISASMGISCYPNDSMDIQELMHMADKALYSSKHEGRNTYRYYSKMVN